MFTHAMHSLSYLYRTHEPTLEPTVEGVAPALSPVEKPLTGEDGEPEPGTFLYVHYD